MVLDLALMRVSTHIRLAAIVRPLATTVVDKRCVLSGAKDLVKCDGRIAFNAGTIIQFVKRGDMTTALVTGITGFVGSRLAERLLNDGYDVFGLIRPCASRDLKVIEPLLPEITLLVGDLTSVFSLSNVLRTASPDIVFHLAALSPVRYSFERPFEYQEINYMGTLNLVHSLMELSDYKKRRLVAASTAEVYGMQANMPFKEELGLKPSSPYAVSKAAMDMYLRMAMGVFDLNCVILRPTNSYGRKYEKGFIMEYLITSMLSGERVYLGAPESIRDYLYVEDHVGAYILAAERENARGQVFNVGSGMGISNKDLALRISEILDFDVKKIELGSYPPRYPLRPLVSDQPYLVLDSTKISRELGWAPKVGLEEGIRMVADYWKAASK